MTSETKPSGAEAAAAGYDYFWLRSIQQQWIVELTISLVVVKDTPIRMGLTIFSVLCSHAIRQENIQ